MVAVALGAGALWAGLLLGWGRIEPSAGGWMLALGAGAVLLVGRRRRGSSRDAAALGERERVLAAAGFLSRPPHVGRPVLRTMALAAATLLIGLAWAGLRLRPSPDLGPLEGRSAPFLGTARSDPRSFPTGWGVEVRVDRAGDRPLGHLVWVSGRGEPPQVAAGDRVRGAGRFRRVEGEEGFERYLTDRGVAALVSASELGRDCCSA